MMPGESWKVLMMLTIIWCLDSAGKSVKEFVNACIKATGVNMTVTYLDRRPGDYAEVYSDPSKIKQDMNWTAQHVDLTKTLREAWHWRQAHPNGYKQVSLLKS